MSDTRVCSVCRVSKLPAEFYADKRRPDGLKSQCRTCHNEGNLRSRNEDRKRDANREYMARARGLDPEKFRARERSRPSRDPIRLRARAELNRAIRRGEIARPATCRRCGQSGRVTGHHPDYSKPLEVEWLCYRCHGLEHRAVEVSAP